MILVAGGLADGVTELVCARLADCSYAYRLLDLGCYPAGHRVAWRWRDGRPEGTIARPDWSLDLADITGVYVRFLGPDGARRGDLQVRYRRPLDPRSLSGLLSRMRRGRFGMQS